MESVVNGEPGFFSLVVTIILSLKLAEQAITLADLSGISRLPSREPKA